MFSFGLRPGHVQVDNGLSLKIHAKEMIDRLTLTDNRFLMSRGSMEMTVRSLDCEHIEFSMYCEGIVGYRGGPIGL